MMRVPLLVTGALAILIAGYAWYRTLTFSAVTGPQRAQWYDASNQPVDTTEIGETVGNGLMINTMVLGDRLIVPTSGPRRGGPGGFAWISPSHGEARIAWPIESEALNAVEGVAVRDVDHFALVLNIPKTKPTPDDSRRQLAVGIAGPTAGRVRRFPSSSRTTSRTAGPSCSRPPGSASTSRSYSRIRPPTTSLRGGGAVVPVQGRAAAIAARSSPRSLRRRAFAATRWSTTEMFSVARARVGGTSVWFRRQATMGSLGI